jgi:hydroxyacylglutathione hydrolase
MHIERFFVPGLAHASYIVSSCGDAVVIDPERRVEDYLDYLAKHRLTLRGILLTHPHADFVAGHAELAARSNAPVFISARAPAQFDHRDIQEGDRIGAGNIYLEVIDTPGHSPDSVCFCLHEANRVTALFSGDTLFAGDVGRPDLRDGEITAEQLAGMLYDSLFQKLLKLPFDIKIYPGHGAGSLCGRQISSAPFTTIGQESATNWALQFTDRTKFISAMITNLPERPSYFARSVTINLQGAPAFTGSVIQLNLDRFGSLRGEGASILDVRPAALFGEGHAAGSVNIGVASPSFAVWCGFFINGDLPILLVVDHEGEARQAKLELARIGFDQVAGFLVADDLEETLQITQLGAQDFLAAADNRWRSVVLDVRTAQEWSQDRLEGAIHIALPQLLRQIGKLSRQSSIAVVCGSGYRSSIATSLLESEGFPHVSNVMGGMHAIRHAKRPHVAVMEFAESVLDWQI